MPCGTFSPLHAAAPSPATLIGEHQWGSSADAFSSLALFFLLPLFFCLLALAAVGILGSLIHIQDTGQRGGGLDSCEGEPQATTTFSSVVPAILQVPIEEEHNLLEPRVLVVHDGVVGPPGRCAAMIDH